MAPSEELTADLYEIAIPSVATHGLRQYEISNFARSGSQSRHNLKYWQRKPYLGFGLDAHSMVRTRQGSALRFCNPAELAEYQSGKREAARRLSLDEELEEAWFLGLRLNEGIAWQALAAEFGYGQVAVFEPVVRDLCELGLLHDQDGILRLTRRGVLFSNEVFSRFLAEQFLVGEIPKTVS
jgi:oxygen-independent coproporphyrinogen-3 oxidase